MNIKELIGMPYKEGEHDPSTGFIDCWGLVRYILETELSISLNKNPYTAAEMFFETWCVNYNIKFPVLQKYDVIFITPNKIFSNHLALVLSPTEIIHTRHNTGVVIDKINRVKSIAFQTCRLRKFGETYSDEMKEVIKNGRH